MIESQFRSPDDYHACVSCISKSSVGKLGIVVSTWRRNYQPNMSDTTGATPPAVSSHSSGIYLPRGGGRGNPDAARGSGNNHRSINRHPKFEGACADLKGSIFDCSGYEQADGCGFTTLMSHVGRPCTHGRATSKAMKSFVSPTVTMPIAPDHYVWDRQVQPIRQVPTSQS